jgi:acyl dehydratase
VAKRIFQNLDELVALTGHEVGVSDWVDITQERINQFAEATGDHQWIHVDPVLAANGPFKTTIAHGFLTLSLIPMFADMALAVNSAKMGVNYGVNKVRFTNPVPVGAKLRARFKLLESKPIDNNGVQQTMQVMIERQGVEKPVCIAETVALRYE